MSQQTYQQYVQEALIVIAHLSFQEDFNLFDVTITIAWRLFREYVETQSASLLRENYSSYGSRFQSDLPLCWPAFQYEMASSLGLF